MGHREAPLEGEGAPRLAGPDTAAGPAEPAFSLLWAIWSSRQDTERLLTTSVGHSGPGLTGRQTGSFVPHTFESRRGVRLLVLGDHTVSRQPCSRGTRAVPSLGPPARAGLSSAAHFHCSECCRPPADPLGPLFPFVGSPSDIQPLPLEIKMPGNVPPSPAPRFSSTRTGRKPTPSPQGGGRGTTPELPGGQPEPGTCPKPRPCLSRSLPSFCWKDILKPRAHEPHLRLFWGSRPGAESKAQSGCVTGPPSHS